MKEPSSFTPSSVSLTRVEIEEAIDSGDPWLCRNLLALALIRPSASSETVAQGVYATNDKRQFEAVSLPDKNGETIAKLDKALQHVYDICQERARWRMSIPANPEYDSDLILCEALESARRDLSASSATDALEARRYRWLRDRTECRFDGGSWWIDFDQWIPVGQSLPDGAFDKGIDAAMASTDGSAA